MILGASATAVLVILHRIAKGSLRRSNLLLVEARVTNATLRRQSGFSKNIVSQALHELKLAGHILSCPERRRSGEFGSSLYLICNPANGQPLTAKGAGCFLYAHRIPYFTFPSCVISETGAHWSLANMSKSEKHLYISLCWLANIRRNNQYSTTREDLATLTRIATRATIDKALRGLEDKALLSVEGTSGSPTIKIHLFDPYTGEPLQDQTVAPEDDPANYRITGTNRRVILNSTNPAAVEYLVISHLPQGAQVVNQSNGGFLICCPFHPDNRPSCSVSPAKRCFNCFGCHEKGTLTKLLMKLSGESQGAIIRKIVEAEGSTAEFHPPDDHIEAIYAYHDKEGRLVKQVLRYKGKRFSQRRLTSRGWIYTIAGARPLLYNLHRLVEADTVVICEGEKDCDTLMTLSLWGASSELISTTSGSWNSWHDEFADDLTGKRVVIMPDNDDAGLKYLEAVRSSLESRGIGYRIVDFDDVGAKDISDFLEKGHSKDELADRIGRDWVSTEAPSMVPQIVQFEDA